MTVSFKHSAIRLMWGIPLSATLMSGLNLAFSYLYIQYLDFPSGDKELWLPPLLFIGTALGGAMGLRLAHLSWRETILAAWLAGLGLILYTRFFFARPWEIGIRLGGGPVFWFGYFETPLSNPSLDSLLWFLLVITAGVFLLPLFDPIVRNAGPAPSLRWIWLTLLLLMPCVIWITPTDVYYGLIFESLVPALMVLLALILSLAGWTEGGARLGGLAVLLPFFFLGRFLLFSAFS